MLNLFINNRATCGIFLNILEDVMVQDISYIPVQFHFVFCVWCTYYTFTVDSSWHVWVEYFSGNIPIASPLNKQVCFEQTLLCVFLQSGIHTACNSRSATFNRNIKKEHFLLFAISIFLQNKT